MRQALASFLPSGSEGGYAGAYRKLIERGLTDAEWKPIESFYADFASLASANGFEPMVVIMPVDDIVAQRTPAAHAYPAEARRRLDAMGIPYVDAFTLWQQNGYGRKYFLPQGHDSHLSAEGYRIVAAALTDSMLARPEMRAALQGKPPKPAQ
jgi:hypothetical protein